MKARYLSLPIPQLPPQVCEFRGGNEVVIEILHHDTSKLDILTNVSVIICSRDGARHHLHPGNQPWFDKCAPGSRLDRVDG